MGRVREEKRREEERRSEKRKSQKKEDAGARKGTKAAIHCVLPVTRGSGRSKSRLAKAAGVEAFGQMLARRDMKKCTPLWCKAHFEVKMRKTFQPQIKFRNCDVEKVHGGVERSTCRSQKC